MFTSPLGTRIAFIGQQWYSCIHSILPSPFSYFSPSLSPPFLPSRPLYYIPLLSLPLSRMICSLNDHYWWITWPIRLDHFFDEWLLDCDLYSTWHIVTDYFTILYFNCTYRGWRVRTHCVWTSQDVADGCEDELFVQYSVLPRRGHGHHIGSRYGCYTQLLSLISNDYNWLLVTYCNPTYLILCLIMINYHWPLYTPIFSSSSHFISCSIFEHCRCECVYMGS